MKRLLACRLCRRITWAVFALLMAVEVAILVPSAQRFEREAVAGIAHAVQAAAAIVLGASADAPRDVLAERLRALLGLNGIRGIGLYDRAGDPALALGIEAAAAGVPPQRPADRDGVVVRRSSGGDLIGVSWVDAGSGLLAHATVSAAAVGPALHAYMLRIAGLVLVVVIAVTVGIMLLLQYSVLQPVLRLRGSLLGASRDPTRAEAYQIDLPRRDELGELAQALNQMLVQVAESRRREHARAEARARRLTTCNSVTGLPNREALLARLTLNTAETQVRRVSLFLTDIARFSVINASVGPVAGNEILQQFGARLREVARPGDMVAHLGADRFVLVRFGPASDAGRARTAEQLVRAADGDYVLEAGGVVAVAVRVGVADGDCATLDAASLLSRAEFALDRARAAECAWQAYSAELAEEAKARQALLHELDAALGAGQFFLALQPRFAFEPGGAMRLAGAEALLRWRHPERGLVSPGLFIPAAEASGLIVPIGDFVIDAACARIADWTRRHGWSPRIAVNLSAKQFGLPDLTERLRRALERHAVAAEHLEVEITETAAMSDVDRTSETLKGLRALGVHVSIDDFGTGYSSLAYLRRFAVDAIKIDKSFVDDIGVDRNAEAICDAILRLSHSLGTRVVAEGVETEPQAAFLRQRRCDEAQGFLFGRPVPADEFARAWMHAQTERAA